MRKACPTTFNSTKTDIPPGLWLPPTGIHIPHPLLNSVVCPPFNPALITLSSQCSDSCLFPLQFSSHPFTENVHPPLTRTHSFTWLLNKNLFKNKYTRIRTHLLVMPRGPQLLAVVLKTHAAREKGQRSMLAVDSYYSPILSFSQDQWVRWLSENKKREKDRLRKRESESERETPTILI